MKWLGTKPRKRNEIVDDLISDKEEIFLPGFALGDLYLDGRSYLTVQLSRIFFFAAKQLYGQCVQALLLTNNAIILHSKMTSCAKRIPGLEKFQLERSKPSVPTNHTIQTDIQLRFNEIVN